MVRMDDLHPLPEPATLTVPAALLTVLLVKRSGWTAPERLQSEISFFDHPPFMGHWKPPLETASVLQEGGAAQAFWRAAGAKVAAGTHVLLAAWNGGVLAGTATLAMDMPQNQPHRAEVAKVLVDPAIRRRGLARALMTRVEQEATRAGRPLLLLDTQAGGAAERLYRSMGWTELGTMPGHALHMDGTFGDTVFFWKRLAVDG